MSDVTNHWRVRPGAEPGLAQRDPTATSGAPGDRAATERAAASEVLTLASWQDRLAAEHGRSLLVILQGMDASGKDGTIKHVFSGVNPQGVHVTSFKVPAGTEVDHDFLWRVHRHAPAAGDIAIWNRSHYEDVIVPRVRRTMADKLWRRRYEDIVGFERTLAHAGTDIVKIFLHISFEEQGQRLAERLEQPDKRWKAQPSDFDDRQRWGDFHAAYEEAMTATSTEHAPWYVIPAGHRWFRNWAVGQVLVHHLEALDPRYPDLPGPGS